MTYGVTSSFFSLNNTWRDDAFVMDESASYATILLSQAQHFDIATELVDFVLNVGEETGNVPLRKQRDDTFRKSSPWSMRLDIQRYVQRS